MESKWIPITDEMRKDPFNHHSMPDMGEFVWVTNNTGNVHLLCYAYTADGIYDWYNINTQYFCSMNDIVAWMPFEIPKPY